MLKFSLYLRSIKNYLMKKLILAAAFLILMATTIAGQNQQRPQMAPNPDTIETYLYAVKGKDSLFLDRHINPAKINPDKKIPTMIYMFGGGWAYGSRRGRYNYLTEIGVQVISIDYRKALEKYGYSDVIGPMPDTMSRAINIALDDLTDAMSFVIKHADEWNVDLDKVMLSGSSAGAITTLMSIYDICNDGPYSKKFPAGFMPAGYIGYAGAIINEDKDLVWNKKPCPMMFFHGSGDTTVPYDMKRVNKLSVYGPQYILKQLHEMEVPNALYVEEDADHVMSYKPFSGYNTNEIQTFVEKFVIQGLKLEMKTTEYNMIEPSHLPGMPSHPRKQTDTK